MVLGRPVCTPCITCSGIVNFGIRPSPIGTQSLRPISNVTEGCEHSKHTDHCGTCEGESKAPIIASTLLDWIVQISFNVESGSCGVAGVVIGLAVVWLASADELAVPRAEEVSLVTGSAELAEVTIVELGKAPVALVVV